MTPLVSSPFEPLARPDLSLQSLLQLVAIASGLSHSKQAIQQYEEALQAEYQRRFAELAQQLRRQQGKDTGVVSFDDGDVRITADLPKKVEWDQAKLADIARRIVASGDDPAQYVEISYRVSESKFNAWPESLRSAFVPARTVKVGKPKFTLGRVGEGQP
jgi:predicted phage gp36 major capsid-like protein